MSDDMRARLAALRDKIIASKDWPVVVESDGGQWVDRDWIVAEIEGILA